MIELSKKLKKLVPIYLNECYPQGKCTKDIQNLNLNYMTRYDAIFAVKKVRGKKKMTDWGRERKGRPNHSNSQVIHEQIQSNENQALEESVCGDDRKVLLFGESCQVLSCDPNPGGLQLRRRCRQIGDANNQKK